MLIKENVMSTVNETILKELHERNLERAKRAKEELGDKHLYHPSNRVPRKDTKPGVLEIPRYLLKTF